MDDIEKLKAQIAEDIEPFLKAKNEAKEEDSLSKIFRLQKSFDEVVQNDPRFKNKTQEQKVVALLGHALHEIIETRNSLGTIVTGEDKWWRDEFLTPDRWSEVTGELIDVLHFLVSAMLHAGLEAEDIIKEYEKKNKENHARQERGY